MGTPPSVARSLLARGFPQATTKRHFEHSQTQFPDGCCRKNTCLERAEIPIRNVHFWPPFHISRHHQANGIAYESCSALTNGTAIANAADKPLAGAAGRLSGGATEI
jgi:hypothetical protein